MTTAVDIYSFGMCALEVRNQRERGRGQIRIWKGRREGVGKEPRFLSFFLFLLTADGSAGDSGQWGILLRATGSYQQCHPASRRPVTEGEDLQNHFS